MNLGNPIKAIVHYFLIRRMTDLNHQDKFLMVSTLVCIVIHWTRLIMNHDVRVLDYHDWPSYYIVRTLNLEKILSLCWNQQKALTYGWDHNVVIYSYELSHHWWRLVTIGIHYKDIMISHRIKTTYPIEWSKGHVIMKLWM